MQTYFTKILIWVFFLILSLLTTTSIQANTSLNHQSFQRVIQDPIPLNLEEVVNSIKVSTMCLENKIDGEIIVSIHVSSSGAVEQLFVKKSPNAELSEACQKKLMNLRFVPATNVRGEAINVWTTLTIRISLGRERC